MAPVAATRRRSGCGRVALVGVLVVISAVVVAAVGVALALRRLDQPAAVPPDFRPATTLARAATGLPAGWLAFDSDRMGNFEIFTMAPDGTGVRQLTSDPTWDSWWPRVSPDRRAILFYRTPKGTHDRDFTATSLWSMASDGTGAQLLRPAGIDGWTQQGHAEWSPDGSQLVMFGGNRTNPQIFLTDALGRHPIAVTDRPGANLDPSFAPDGRTIVFTGCPSAVCFDADYEVYAVDAAARSSADARRLTDDDLRDHDPYYSPDGKQLAWLTQVGGGLPGSWDIRIAAADGTGARRLVGDDGISSRPQWSADGTTIYFHRLRSSGGFGVFAIAPDGSGLREITAGQPGSNEYPAT